MRCGPLATLHEPTLSDSLLDAAFAWLRKTDLAALEPGRHGIDGTALFAMASAYESAPREAGRYEAHHRYADLQVVVSGRERILVRPCDGLVEEAPFDAEKDCVFYPLGPAGEESSLLLGAGGAAILLPGEAHCPGRKAAEPGPAEAVRKVVVKIEVAQP